MAQPANTLLRIQDIGSAGVNVDTDPLSMDDQELRLAQNVIRDPLGADSGLRKRPGLVAFTVMDTDGNVLGGANLPLQDLSPSGAHFIYIGRGPL